jgi:hypothetical protein
MLKIKSALGKLLLAAVFIGAATQTEAQSRNYRGNFTLPFEARVGSSVLPPGKYTVETLNGFLSGIRIVGANGKASILASSYLEVPETEGDKMTLVVTDGVPTLESLDMGYLRTRLTFHLAKHRQGGIKCAAAKQTIDVGMP